jgi:hypothetical protein
MLELEAGLELEAEDRALRLVGGEVGRPLALPDADLHRPLGAGLEAGLEATEGDLEAAHHIGGLGGGLVLALLGGPVDRGNRYVSLKNWSFRSGTSAECDLPDDVAADGEAAEDQDGHNGEADHLHDDGRLCFVG